MAPLPEQPAAEYRRLERELRNWVIGDNLKPGERLPTSRELAKRFDASQPTLHRAMANLVSNGFLETRGRAGTFVADHPPHLCRFGLAFLNNPGAGDAFWSRFHHALYSASQAARLAAGRRFIPFFNLIDRDATNPAQIELREDVANHRLAGLILVGAGDMLESVTQHMDPSLPRVALQESTDPMLPSIAIDQHAWLRRAMVELHRRGRRRIAWISLQVHGVSTHDHASIDLMQQLAQQTGLSTEPAFYQPASLQAPQSATQAIRLLMSLPDERRPDGLIISDDNLVPYAVQGLITSGTSVGSGASVDVVAHANFPHAVPSPLPLIHFGYDVRHMLAHALGSLDAQRPVPLKQRPRNQRFVMQPMLADAFDLRDNPLYESIDQPMNTPSTVEAFDRMN